MRNTYPSRRKACVAVLALMAVLPVAAGDEDTATLDPAVMTACFNAVLCAGDASRYSDYCTAPNGSKPRRDLSIGERIVLLTEACKMRANAEDPDTSCCGKLTTWTKTEGIVELIVDHRTGTWRVESHDQKVPWETDVNGVPTVFLNSSVKPVVWVEGSSPLLYSANLGEVTEEEAAGQTDLAKLMTTTGGSLGTGITKWPNQGGVRTLKAPPVQPATLGVAEASESPEMVITADSISGVVVTLTAPPRAGVLPDQKRVPTVRAVTLPQQEVLAAVVSGGARVWLQGKVGDTKILSDSQKSDLSDQVGSRVGEIEAYLVWNLSDGGEVNGVIDQIDTWVKLIKAHTDAVAKLTDEQGRALELLRDVVEQDSSPGDACRLDAADSSSTGASGSTSITHLEVLHASLTTVKETASPSEVPCEVVVRAYRELINVHPGDPQTAAKLIHNYHLANDEATRQAAQAGGPAVPLCGTLGPFFETLGIAVGILEEAIEEGDSARFREALQAQRRNLRAPANSLVEASEARAKGVEAKTAAVKAGDVVLKGASTLDRFVQRCFTSQRGTGFSTVLLPPQGNSSDDGASRRIEPKWNTRRTYPVSIALDTAYKADVYTELPAERATKFRVVPRWRRDTAFAVGVTWTDLVSPTWEAAECPTDGSVPSCVGAPSGDEAPKYVKRTREDSQAGKFAIFGSWLPIGSVPRGQKFPSPPAGLRGGFELGLGLDTDHPAVFAGISLQCGRWLKVSGGYTAQQVAGLRGMEEGDLLSRGGVVVTKDTLDHSFYLSLSLTLDGLSVFSGS